MVEDLVTYRSNIKYSLLPPCTLNINYFQKLYDILQIITSEAADIEVSKLEKAPDQTDDDFNKLKEYARSLYKLSIQILGSKGEHIISESSTFINEKNFPDRVNKIIFDNSFKYNYHLKKDPLNKIRIEFDFQNTNAFSFRTNPSDATFNNSYINVIGENETWVSGAYDKVMESIKERGNKRGILHKHNVYDIFLWIFGAPLILWIIYKIDCMYMLRNSKLSIVFVVALYLYIFIISTYIIKFLFDYTRWIFPKIELIASLKKGAMAHRIILGAIATIFLAIFGGLIFDMLKLIFS